MRRLAASLLAACLGLSAGTTAAGMLLEAELDGVPIRVEVGADPTRALADVDGASHLLEIGGGSTAPSPQPFVLEQWSDGPLVADYGTTYHVLIGGERICAEVLSSPWMTGFTEPLVRAVERLQATVPTLAPRPQGECGTIGFRSYAADGFPLMAGYRGQPVFRVTRLRFDHYPTTGPLAPPAQAGGSVAP